MIIITIVALLYITSPFIALDRLIEIKYMNRDIENGILPCGKHRAFKKIMDCIDENHIETYDEFIDYCRNNKKNTWLKYQKDFYFKYSCRFYFGSNLQDIRKEGAVCDKKN